MGMERVAPAEETTAAELARRTAMLSAIGDASAAIVAAADWRRAIGDMLEGIGRGAEASRASLFEVHTGPGGLPVQSCRFDWAEPPWEPMASNPVFHDMSLSDDPERPGDIGRWSQRRQRGEVIQATLSQVTGRIRDAYVEAGSLSFISVPVMACGRWWGFIGFDDCRSPRVWSPVEVDVLKTAAGLVASAIERQQAQGEVARRTAMMDAVSETAAKIVAPGDWRREIDGLLRRLGEATGSEQGEPVRSPSGAPRPSRAKLPPRLGRAAAAVAVRRSPLPRHAAIGGRRSPGGAERMDKAPSARRSGSGQSARSHRICAAGVSRARHAVVPLGAGHGGGQVVGISRLRRRQGRARLDVG